MEKSGKLEPKVENRRKKWKIEEKNRKYEEKVENRWRKCKLGGKNGKVVKLKV